MNYEQGLMLARVITVHQHDQSVDVQLNYNGSRLTGVPVMSHIMSTSSGFCDLHHPEGNDYDAPGSATRDIYAIVGWVANDPIIVGFLSHQINQMMFDRKNFKMDRHASDVYSTIDQFGNYETRHPSGTYIRIAENPNHEDLFEQDFDKKWEITRNTDKKPYIHVNLRVGNEHKASVLMTPDGEIEVHATNNIAVRSDKDIYVHADGNVQISADGDVGVRAGANAYVHAEGDMEASSIGNMALRTEADAYVHAEGDVQIDAGNDIGIRALGETFIHSEGDVQLTTNASATIRAQKDVFIHSNGATQVSTKGDVGIQSAGKAFIHSTGDMEITTTAKASIKATGDVLVQAGGNAQVTAARDAKLVAGGNAFVKASGDAQVSGVNVMLDATGEAQVKSSGNITLQSGAVVEIKSTNGSYVF